MYAEYISRATPQFCWVEKGVKVNGNIMVMDRAFIFQICVTDRQYSGHFGHRNKTVKKIILILKEIIDCVLGIFLTNFLWY